MDTGLRVTESEIENDRYLVRLNAAGDVESIRDKEADRELLASPLTLELLNDLSVAWPAWEIRFEDIIARPRRTVGGPATVRVVERGPARVAMEISREADGSRFVQRLRLASGGSEGRVEFDTTIDWHTMGTLLKAAFRLAVSNSAATYDLGLGAIERPTGTPRLYEVPGHQWADVTDAKGDYGVTILNDSKYGWDMPDEHTLRLTLLHTPETGDQAYTDQATQDLGRHRFTYAICGHKDDWRTAAPWEAARLNQPLIAFQAPGHAGALGRTFSLVSLDTPQVAVRAIKMAESGDEIIVRLQELEGRFADDARISFASGIMAAREVNGSEAPVGPAILEDGDIVADFKPHQLRTFAVRLAAPPARLRPPVSKPVPLPFDLDVASLDEEKNGGDFDGAGHTLPAELLPAAITSQSVRFQFGPTAAPAEKNALSCAGQTIPLPKGNFSRLYLLAASTSGDTKATFLIDGRPTDLVIQEFSGLVGQWDSRVVDGKVVEPDRIVPGFIKRDPIAWLGTHRHTAEGKNEPYVFCYLFRYRIDLPKGAKALVLPKDEHLRILAATAASDVNDDARPAQLLYD
jgi:alpha-mannosidase